MNDWEMDAEHQTLRLPDGYAIEPATDREDQRLLVLKRRDGSAVAILEFSAMGPDPRRIWQIAWEDSEADPGTAQDPATMIGMSSVDQRKASRWARELLTAKEFVVLDSETTGLRDPVGFVEIAVADPEGNPLINTIVKPKIPIEPGAAKIHGYSAETLVEAPAFREVYPQILDALKDKRVIVYNARYDRRVFDTEVRALGARGLLSGRYLPAWECAMGWYSQYIGEPGARGGYKKQKLPGGDHSALGDCRATLELIQKMACDSRP